MVPEERTVRWTDTAQVIRTPGNDLSGESTFRKRIREATEERDRVFKKARIPDRPTRNRPQGPSETSEGTNVAKVELALSRLSIPGAPTIALDSDRTKGIPPRGNELTSGGHNMKISALKGVDQKDIALRAIPIPPRPPRTGSAGEDSGKIQRDPISRPQIPLRPGRKPAKTTVEISQGGPAAATPATPARQTAISASKGKTVSNTAAKTKREKPAPSSEPTNPRPEVIEAAKPPKGLDRKGKGRADQRGEDTQPKVVEVPMPRQGSDRTGQVPAQERGAESGMPPQSADRKGKAPAHEDHPEIVEVAIPPISVDRKGKAPAHQLGRDRPEIVKVAMPPKSADRKGKARADQRGADKSHPSASTPAPSSRPAWTPTPTKSVERTVEMKEMTYAPIRSDFTIAEILSSPANCQVAQKPVDLDEIMSDPDKRSRIRENLLLKQQGPSERKLTRERERLKQEGFMLEPQYVKEAVVARARHNAMGEDERFATYCPLDGPLICGIFEYELGLRTRWDRRQRLFDLMLPVLDDLDALQEERIALLNLT